MEQTTTTTNVTKKSLRPDIVGWGADLDRSKRPGVPGDKAPGISVATLYPDIEPQASNVTVFKSVEHMRMPPVYGTTCPPRGLSGLMRSFAFKFNEAEFTHWLTLLMADRVDMVEGVVTDLMQGKVPNIWNEMGLNAELKYNRVNFQRKVTVAGLVGVGALAFLLLRRRKARTV